MTIARGVSIADYNQLGGVKGGIATRVTQMTVARDFSVANYNNYKVVKAWEWLRGALSRA